MKTRRHHPNLLWTALVALMGLLSVGNYASACSEVKAPKACCASNHARNCGCCGSSAPTAAAVRPEGVEWTSLSAAPTVNVSLPGSTCECRANDPAAPAPKPESRSSDESRTDQGHDEVISYLAYAPRPFRAACRLVSANVSPPKSPLYLRTLHLLV